MIDFEIIFNHASSETTRYNAVFMVDATIEIISNGCTIFTEYDVPIIEMYIVIKEVFDKNTFFDKKIFLTGYETEILRIRSYVNNEFEILFNSNGLEIHLARNDFKIFLEKVENKIRQFLITNFGIEFNDIKKNFL